MKNWEKEGKMSPGIKFLFVFSFILCFVVETILGTLNFNDLFGIIVGNFVLAIIITYILGILFVIVENKNK